MKNMLVALVGLVALILSSGCTPEQRNASAPACGIYFDYAGTYAADVKITQDSGTWDDAFDITVQQNGPAILFANIMGVADAEGMSFGHSWTALNTFWDEIQVVTYSGASRPGDPFTVDLRIEVEFPNTSGLDAATDYVVVLGDEVVFQ